MNGQNYVISGQRIIMAHGLRNEIGYDTMVIKENRIYQEVVGV